MEIDKAGHDQSTVSIKKLRLRILLLKLVLGTYSDDLRTGPCNRALGPHIRGLTTRHHRSVVKDVEIGAGLDHETPRRTHSPVPAGAKNSVPSGRLSKAHWPRT